MCLRDLLAKSFTKKKKKNQNQIAATRPLQTLKACLFSIPFGGSKPANAKQARDH